MDSERARRRHLEAVRRAGLEYVGRDRMTVQLTVAEPFSTPEIIPSIEVVPAVAETEMPRAKKAEPGGASKADLLRVLASEVAACQKCSILAETRTQTVFSDGSAEAELCFVGEAPGADEDEQGLPFVGRAGQLLTKIIEACKLRRDEVYICNVLKCRPPLNRNPESQEIENCRPFLERQLEIIKPKMMVALGKFAAARLLQMPPEKVPITKWRGQFREYCGIPFMITLHPAYLLRNPDAKRDVWDDMKTVMRRLGRPVD